MKKNKQFKIYLLMNSKTFLKQTEVQLLPQEKVLVQFEQGAELTAFFFNNHFLKIYFLIEG